MNNFIFCHEIMRTVGEPEGCFHVKMAIYLHEIVYFGFSDPIILSMKPLSINESIMYFSFTLW